MRISTAVRCQECLQPRSTRTQPQQTVFCSPLPLHCDRHLLFVPESRRIGRSTALQARRRDPVIAPAIPIGPDGDDYCDMFNYLLRNRIVFVGSRITDQVATQTIASLLALEAMDDKEDIRVFINSAGGSAYSVLAIVDAMAQMKCDISTVAYGMCGSVVSLILAAGTKGKRYSMPHTRIMMRQAQGGAQGSAFEVTITASELNRTNQVLNLFYQKFTGLPLERVEEETDRENYLSPKEAMELGLIDGVI